MQWIAEESRIDWAASVLKRRELSTGKGRTEPSSTLDSRLVLNTFKSAQILKIVAPFFVIADQPTSI